MEYVYDISGQHIANFSPSSGALQLAEVFAGGRHLATYTADGNIYFAHSDWLGTERARTTYAGAPYEYCSSLPFGENATCAPASAGGTDVSPLHFTGKERDSESGLDNFGARYFGSSMGRFMSPDFGGPMGESHPDPIPWADLENPQTLNLYSYGNNNPVSNVDEDGHDVSICDTNNNCHTVSNEEYQKAQQGNNGSLNVPTLNQVGMNGDGNGQFNATNITDSNGNTVGTATYVSNGGADYYANRNGIDQLATASATVGSVKGVAAFYGASLVGAVGLYAAGATAGAELTTLGDISLTPTSGEVASAERVLAQGGKRSVERAIRTLSKRLAEHQGKVGGLKGDPGSVYKEIATFSRQIEALKSVLK